MEKTRTANWLIAQGYRLSSLPSKVTWFRIDKVSGKQRGFITQANDYNLNLYRGKGYVLNPKFLDPQAWHELEYGVKPPALDVEMPKQPGPIPRLATAIKEALGKEYFWQGTPTELLELLPPAKQGIPQDAIGLSMQIMKPRVSAALKAYGVDVARHRSNGQRFLQLTCVANVTVLDSTDKRTIKKMVQRVGFDAVRRAVGYY